MKSINFVANGEEVFALQSPPIVQFFPIKRETWKSQKTIKENKFGLEIIKQQFLRGYKNLYWTKKEYF
jgi:hypothetical protein